MKPSRKKDKSEITAGIPAEESVNTSGESPLPSANPRPVRVWLGRVFSFIPRWLSRLKGPVSKAWNWIWGRLRKYLSPSFLVILGLAFLFWYTIQLQAEYTTGVPVRLNIEGTEMRAEIIIKATGYQILSQRYISRKEIELNWSDLDIMPSPGNSRAVVISPLTLQNIISQRYPKLTIVSMGNIPEIEP